MKQVLLIGACAFFLSGCATKGKQPSDASLLKSDAVGVVSLMGNKFSRMHVGHTIFGTENETLAIPDWRIDEEVEAQTKMILERDYKVRTAPPPDFEGGVLEGRRREGAPARAKLENRQ